jgi:hypothetical protein
MKRTSLAILVSLICASAPLFVAQASAQEMKSTSPSMDQLNDFVGDGTCTGNTMAMGKTPGHATTAKYHGEKTLDGKWVVIHYDEDQTAANPKPLHVVQYFTYNKNKNRYEAVALFNDGSSAVGTSSGWKGDELSVDERDPSGAGGVIFRDVFTRGANTDGHTGMMKDKSGKWVKTDEETCHKA